MPAWKEAKDLEIGDMFLESPPRIPPQGTPQGTLGQPLRLLARLFLVVRDRQLLHHVPGLYSNPRLYLSLMSLHKSTTRLTRFLYNASISLRWIGLSK